MENWFNDFINGWRTSSVKYRPTTFWKYFISYPNNWTWTLGSLLFIGLFLHSEVQYQAPIFYVMACIPALMLVYNLVDEYYAFRWSMTGIRKVTSKKLMFIFYGLASLIIISLSIILFLLKTN